MEFPHLKGDTPFPNIESMDVFEYANDFDYGRYSPNVTIELCQVPWSADYSACVDFGSEAEREAWFNSQIVKKIELNNCMCRIPTEALNVPLPYDEAMRYNYVRVKRPMLTSDSNPVDFETQNRVASWYYFIVSENVLATNTTELMLAIDWFTTFWYTCDHPYCILERGHYPMTQVTPEQFLSAPLENNRYLLPPEPPS